MARAELDALERIAIGAVAVTARAIARVAPELTILQWRLLVISGETSGGTSVSDAAARIGIALPTASRLVSRLERRGLVRVARDERDRRVRRVALTAEGATLRRDVLATRRLFLAEVLEATETEGGSLESGLTSVAKAFDRLS